MTCDQRDKATVPIEAKAAGPAHNMYNEIVPVTARLQYCRQVTGSDFDVTLLSLDNGMFSLHLNKRSCTPSG